jgi:hypothetical protein
VFEFFLGYFSEIISIFIDIFILEIMFKKIVWLGFTTKGKNAKDIEPYIQSLVDGGANEFFTWYNPAYWSDKFGFEVSPNGRFAEHEQITDIGTLEKIVEEVHKYGLEIFVNLNAWYYTDLTMPYIERMVEEFEKVWVDGIICGNISILEYLKDRWYKWKINISTILAVYNTESIRFFLENYDINKVILSREMTLREIEILVNAFPDTQFEVFGEWDFCRYNNGLCFAEHKYGAKDICTVVVRDLVFKKIFCPDFKNIILDESLDNKEKVDMMDDEYLDVFEEIENIFEKIDLLDFMKSWAEKENLENFLIKIIRQNKNRVDLFYDALKPINSEHNSRVITFLKWLKYCFGNDLLKNDKKIFEDLRGELEYSIQSWLGYHLKKQKELGWGAKLKALELGSFYAKSDNLNLYSYLFFSKFKNIETVKFPTRWRGYNEKIRMISDVVERKGSNIGTYIDRWVSLERVHYDLSYLFQDSSGKQNKLWFRELGLNH